MRFILLLHLVNGLTSRVSENGQFYRYFAIDDRKLQIPRNDEAQDAIQSYFIVDNQIYRNTHKMKFTSLRQLPVNGQILHFSLINQVIWVMMRFDQTNYRVYQFDNFDLSKPNEGDFKGIANYQLN